MTDAACQRCPEGRAPQSRTSPAWAGRSAGQCRQATGARLFHFAASSVPIPRTSSATEGARPSSRSQTGIYRQASTQPDSAGPDVRGYQSIVHQRGGQPGIAGAAAARARAWVSRKQIGDTPFSWSIDLIACYRTSWCKFTSCWCQTNGGPSAESGNDLWNRQNPSGR